MYQGHSVKRKILPFTEWSPDTQQLGAITHSVFFCGRKNCCQRGERRWFASWCEKGTEPLLHIRGREISASPSQQETDQQKRSHKPLVSSTDALSVHITASQQCVLSSPSRLPGCDTHFITL